MDTKIPKKIHYCWFGGNPLSPLALKCIDSWKKYCPDYEIIEWNESNFDINYNDYVKEAYQKKKWAFVTDVVRLYVLINYGGVYMDTDVELLKSLDELLDYEAVSGFESEDRIPTGLMAAQKGHPLFIEMINDYENEHFLQDYGEYNNRTNVERITEICKKYGLMLNNSLQTVNGFTLLPNDYLCPKNFMTGDIRITDNTICIHHFNGSWLSDEDKDAIRFGSKLNAIFPRRLSLTFGGYISALRHRGIIRILKKRIKRKKIERKWRNNEN